jgi:lysophospholipase L1-like esterase
LDGIRDGVIQSFRGAGLGYIKHMIDTEYLYLYDINRFSHIILHFGTNDVQKYSVDVITCKFRNLIYSVRRKNPDISILISSVLPRPTDFDILGEKVVAINNRLVGICKEEQVQFIKSFRRFLHQGKPKRDLFSIRDALHLNDAGVLQLKLCFIHVFSHL